MDASKYEESQTAVNLSSPGHVPTAHQVSRR